MKITFIVHKDFADQIEGKKPNREVAYCAREVDLPETLLQQLQPYQASGQWSVPGHFRGVPATDEQQLIEQIQNHLNTRGELEANEVAILLNAFSQCDLETGPTAIDFELKDKVRYLRCDGMGNLHKSMDTLNGVFRDLRRVPKVDLKQLDGLESRVLYYLESRFDRYCQQRKVYLHKCIKEKRNYIGEMNLYEELTLSRIHFMLYDVQCHDLAAPIYALYQEL